MCGYQIYGYFRFYQQHGSKNGTLLWSAKKTNGSLCGHDDGLGEVEREQLVATSTFSRRMASWKIASAKSFHGW